MIKIVCEDFVLKIILLFQGNNFPSEKYVAKKKNICINRIILNEHSQLIPCCELLTLFERYYQKKFGVDGVILFTEESEEFLVVHSLTNSLFKALSKKKLLCENCEKWPERLKG